MKALSCAVLGEDKLARDCAVTLSEMGHELVAEPRDDTNLIFVTASSAAPAMPADRTVLFHASARWPQDAAAGLADSLSSAEPTHLVGWQRADGAWLSVVGLPIEETDTAALLADRIAAAGLEEFERLLVAYARSGGPESEPAPAAREPSPVVQNEAIWRELVRTAVPSRLEHLRARTDRRRQSARGHASIALPPQATDVAHLVAAAAIAAARCLQADRVTLAFLVPGQAPLPLSVDVPATQTFAPVLAQSASALAVSKLPFPSADAPRRWLAWPSREWAAEAALHIAADPGRAGLPAGEPPLLHFSEEGGRIVEAGLVFDAGRFEPAFVAALAEAIGTVLAAGLASPDLEVTRLPLLSSAAQDRLQRARQETERAFPHDRSLMELVAGQAQRTPDLPALSYGATTYSYRALEAATDRLARRILALHRAHAGDAPLTDRPVVLCLERSDRLIVAVHAILKAGGAYLPLDTNDPDERLAGLLGLAEPALIVTTKDLAARHGAAFAGRPVLDLDETEPADDQAPLPAPAAPHDLAYVLFTSGSTGTPKGVMIEHRGVVNRLEWMRSTYGFGPGHRVLQKTPYTFDVSAWEFFLPFMAGAELVVAEPDGHRDPRYLVDTIRTRAITHLHFVPSMLAVFLQAEGVETLGSLQRVFASGEALPPGLVRRFWERLPGCPLENLYGPTEASIDVSFHSCQPQDTEASSIPIGHPIDNCALYVLDRDMQLLPTGVPGELWIGGIQLARAYLGRPDLTAERFVPDPFAEDGRLYRTGDIARQLPDGAIEYLGRRDHQVKIRGMRVELGEIEAVLCDGPGVAAAVVTQQAFAHGDVTVAYLVGTATPMDIERHVERWLPKHMHPDRCVFLERLPLTASGKVDRTALPPLAEEEPSAGPHDSYGDQRAASLADIWRRLLKRRDIRLVDNFFQLGGNSLLAGEMLLRIEEDFGVNLTFRKLYENPTLERLAACLSSGTSTAGTGVDRSRQMTVEEF